MRPVNAAKIMLQVIDELGLVRVPYNYRHDAFESFSVSTGAQNPHGIGGFDSQLIYYVQGDTIFMRRSMNLQHEPWAMTQHDAKNRLKRRVAGIIRGNMEACHDLHNWPNFGAPQSLGEGDRVFHIEHGVGTVVWQNPRLQSGHLLARFGRKRWYHYLVGRRARDTYACHLTKLSPLEHVDGKTG